MARRYTSLLIKSIYIVIDVLVIYWAIFLACFLLKERLLFPVSFSFLFLDHVNPFRLLFLFLLLTTIVFINSHDLYSTRREISEGVEVWRVLKSVLLSALVVIVAIYFLKLEGFPRSVFALICFFMFFFLSSWRILKRLFVEHLVSQGYNNINALIIGAGKVGAALAEEIQARPGLGIKVVGFLDDAVTGQTPSSGVKILGPVSDLSAVARREFISKIFITAYHESRIFLPLLEQARSLGIAVRVVPQGYDLTTGEFIKYNIGIIPILEYGEAEQIRRQFGKRLFDFVLAMILFVFALPVFLVLALWVKAESPGPVFYKSRRYGRRGQIFHMYKFRSMVQNAEDMLPHLRVHNEVDGPIFKMRADPRVTRAGRFLRRYSLDELPQILNVIKGDMSLVGPRPLPIEQIEKEDLRQLERLEVRPGITGLWQIRGRSDIAFSRLIKWDIWYINNWSFWLDINILLQTWPVVMKGKGAY